MARHEFDPKVQKVIESRKNDIARTISELVRIPSRTGEEGEAQIYMRNLYDNLPAEVKYLDTGVTYLKPDAHTGRPNVIAVLKGEPPARSLVINGHVDVVPVEPERSWKLSPWSGEIVGDRLYGRGSLDMKAGLVLGYYALKCLLEAGYKPEGTVILESVIEEESQGPCGTLACLKSGYLADGTVVTEPTGETISIAGSGVHWFRVRVYGNPVHASRPQLGANAILKMNKVLQALTDLGERRAKENHHDLIQKYGGPSCTFNIGRYRAGDWPSTAAAWAELDCRVGHVPGETALHVRQQVEETIKEATKSDDWLKAHPPEIEWFGLQAEPWEQDPDHPLVKAFGACAKRVLKRPVLLAGGTACMDTQYMPQFSQASIAFGPMGDNSHGLNEWVSLPSVINCTKTLASFIADWCGVGK